MRKDAIAIEENRVGEIHRIRDYPSYHERHRIFPKILEGRSHRKVLDIAAGVGVVGKRIMTYSDIHVLCNDISPTCLETMRNEGIETVSFDIDDGEARFPFQDGEVDAVISLATIEHVLHIDHHMKEIYRIIDDSGYLYISCPNYSGILYLLPFLISGRTFHDPCLEKDQYEFYAHVRYFTYRSMVEYVSSFGFAPNTVYLPVPETSSRYVALKSRSRIRAWMFRSAMKTLYTCFGPRWASEPVVCFKKNGKKKTKIKKIVL